MEMNWIKNEEDGKMMVDNGGGSIVDDNGDGGGGGGGQHTKYNLQKYNGHLHNDLMEKN